MKYNEMEGIYTISEQLGWRDPALAKMGVLDSQGCCKNYHKLGGLKPEKIYSLTVLEARSSKSKCQ